MSPSITSGSLSNQDATNTSAPSSSPLPPTHNLRKRIPSSSLKDAVCILTGCSSPLGIGRATAHAFALAGARSIYICDVTSTNLSALQSELLSLKSKAADLEIHTRTFDAADEKAVKSTISEALASYNRLDVFFANAGVVGTHKPLSEISTDNFTQTMKINVLSVFLAIKHASPAMQHTSPSKPAPGGSIIATSSVAGLRSNAGSSDYSASKAAVMSLVQTSAYQLAGTGVRVNAVLPGLIETGMTSQLFDLARAAGREGKIGQLYPQQRAGRADEVARVVLFLATDGTYVNGQGWAVDGGLSAGLPFVRGKLA